MYLALSKPFLSSSFSSDHEMSKLQRPVNSSFSSGPLGRALAEIEICDDRFESQNQTLTEDQVFFSYIQFDATAKTVRALSPDLCRIRSEILDVLKENGR